MAAMHEHGRDVTSCAWCMHAPRTLTMAPGVWCSRTTRPLKRLVISMLALSLCTSHMRSNWDTLSPSWAAGRGRRAKGTRGIMAVCICVWVEGLWVRGSTMGLAKAVALTSSCPALCKWLAFKTLRCAS